MIKNFVKHFLSDYCSNAGITLPKPCARDGYQDPTDCERCRCPDGFGGPYCEKHAESINGKQDVRDGYLYFLTVNISDNLLTSSRRNDVENVTS